VSSLAFLSGLGIGMGLCYGLFCRWQQQLRQLTTITPVPADCTGMPLVAQVQRAVQAQQQVVQQLQSHLSVAQSILQVAPLGYLEVDEDNNVCWYNHKLVTLLNIESPEQSLIPRRSLLQIVRSYELDQLINHVRRTHHAQSQDWIFHALQSPRQAKDLPIRGLGFLLDNGHIGVFLEDRWEAMQLAQERDRWTSDVAHELKTPLTSIRLIAETLQPKTNPTLQPWVDQLIQETLRLSHLVQDILELSRLTPQNQQTLQLTDIDLPALIRQAWITLEPLAQSKNLALYYDGPDDYSLRADRAQLLRVLLNLLDNSIKFSPVDTAITVRLSLGICSPCGTHANWVQVDVMDTGHGFPEDSLTLVFQRFYKVDPARGRGTEATTARPQSLGGGSGLGLAIAQQIILAHGGTITARNDPHHGGAWVQILLPPDPTLR
jgi:two-component system, OmpR family, phosphate regulon sensor histidine kinase PhoR